MSSEEFADQARLQESDFTRNRSLPSPLLVTMLLTLRKGANPDELDRFFETLQGEALSQGVTDSAFCQARKKRNPFALVGLNTRLVNHVCARFALRRWRGLRLLAVDGSTVRLPNTAAVRAEFGAPARGATAPLLCPRAGGLLQRDQGLRR